MDNRFLEALNKRVQDREALTSIVKNLVQKYKKGEPGSSSRSRSAKEKLGKDCFKTDVYYSVRQLSHGRLSELETSRSGPAGQPCLYYSARCSSSERFLDPDEFNCQVLRRIYDVFDFDKATMEQLKAIIRSADIPFRAQIDP